MAKKKASDEPVVTQAPMQFLVVDDDDEVRQTVVEYLKSFGYRKILEAHNGQEALDILKNEHIDFVISDWEMPNKTGLELLRTIRDEETTKKIPFIMITSPVSKETYKIVEAASAQVDSYIIKPFRAAALKDRIERVLLEKSFEGKLGALVVEDDAGSKDTIIEYLKQMGRSPIFEAGNGDEAFRVLEEHHDEIAVVVSDWEMPKMAGIDLLKRIRSDDRFFDLPFIMVTSQSSIERIKLKRALEAEVDHYLLKPFRMDDLKGKVNEALNRVKIKLAADEHLKQAVGAIESASWGEAEAIFQRVISLDPGNVQALLGLAAIQTKLDSAKGLEKRIHYIKEAISINPEYEQAYIELAQTFESAMSLEKAISSLKEALQHCEFSEKIHFHLGRLYLRRGRTEEGLKELGKALELNPNYKEAKELLEINK